MRSRKFEGETADDLALELKPRLDDLVERYERAAFIADDPISVPHGFDDPRDQEVIGLYAALLAWGRRSVILQKAADLAARMDYRPYAFVRDFDAERDGARLAGFKHRTFQPQDVLALTAALSHLIHKHGTIEGAFAAHLPADRAPNEVGDIGPAIQGFSDAVLDYAQLPRLRKHVARPSTKSACKRLAMYCRWMVRPGPVDLGLWTAIRPAQLVLPLDVHTGRQARKLGLLLRTQNDWRAAQALTRRCRALAPDDPCRYDFALFGLGAYDDQPIG
ncbi:MAG: TIGR02757 family protein [Bacteroidota bacterium]